ncbi:hypothetical protein BDR06DRAFT_838348, partial [Suillus hirtellus]
KRFLQALNFSVTLKDKTYTLIAQYVSINLLIECPGLLRLVEGKNHLEDNSLVSMHWIKPPHKCLPTQMMAFAILQVNNATTANKLIKSGLYIDQQLIQVKKDQKEPTRCAKCQCYSHIACNCSASRDMCSTCADNHRTIKYNTYKTFRCASCCNNNHASWSRSCPEFEQRCSELCTKYLENSLPYFPTTDTW